MTKNVKIWKGRLEISKEKWDYLTHDSKLDLFIHANKLELGQHTYEKGWLIFYNEGKYIGSLWINTSTDMKKVEEFLEETK